MNKTIVPIKGMHCRSCEILIEEKLKELPEIKSAQVSYKKSEALVYSKAPLNMAKIKEAVLEAGYEVGIIDSKSWISRNPDEYWDLATSLVILLFLYFVLSKTGLFNLNTVSSNNPSNYAVIILIGLTAGFSTCMALVGGLILGISARHAEKHPEATSVEKFKPHLYFNLGRIISYIILGGLIGLLGKAFALTGPMLGMLTIIVGLVMLILGAQLTEMFPRLSSGGLTLPSSISKALGIKKHHEKEYSHFNSSLVGALTFFLPCGFTQAMQLYAMSTGNFWSGAMIMGAFAIGTAPGLLGVGGLTSIVKGAFAKKFFKFTGLLVIVLAVYNINIGARLTGFNFGEPEQQVDISAEQPVSTETQVIKTTFKSVDEDIVPNNFTVKAGQKVRMEIEVLADGEGCMSTFMIPGLVNKPVLLEKGKNLTFEFTPKKGTYKLVCAMGVQRGVLVAK